MKLLMNTNKRSGVEKLALWENIRQESQTKVVKDVC